MRRIARSRANMASKARKGAAFDTVTIAICIRRREVAEVGRVGEHVRLGEFAGVQRLVPPRKGPVEAALVAQDLLKCPEIVAVPNKEFGVAVHVGHVHLVEAHQIFIAARCRWEIPRWRFVH